MFGKSPARIAVDGVDLTFARGEFVALFGPSGSGKSTLLSIVGGLDAGYEGTVQLFGKSLKELPDRELSRLRGMHIGFVFQAFHLLDHLTVIDNVLVPSLFHPRNDAAKHAMQALDRVGLADRAADRTASLSGGQRQRVAIARAIAHSPALLICDEPTGNLDEDTAAQIVDIFGSLHRQDGTGILCATVAESGASVVAERRHDRLSRKVPEA